MRRNSKGKAEAYLPLLYFVAALALVVALLPTVLRQPPPETNETAELSPDAPPDPDQPALVSSFSRAVSGTAGTGEGTGPGDAVEGIASTGGGTGEGARPTLSCKKGFGNPPRQAESLYSGPCVPLFRGNNGGATAKGVTATEVNVAWFHTLANNQGSEGPIATQPSSGESAQDRTLRVLTTYFNQTYEFYGRTLRMYGMRPSSNDENQRAAAARADEQYRVFAANGVGYVVCDELVRRKVPCFIGQQRESFYESRAPYAWAWYPDATKTMRFAADYACKQLKGRNAQWARDPTLQGPRKLGLLYVDTEEFRGVADEADTFFRDRCGLVFAEKASFTLDTANQQGQAAYATAIARFKAAGVTTPVLVADFVSVAALTTAATSANYYPEWFLPGTGAVDRNQLGQLMNPDQWSQAFGFSGFEMELPIEDSDCHKSYKTIDPVGTPNYGICTWFYPSMVQIANGIQGAGPNLNAKTFEAALFRIGHRFFEDPIWAIGGGFGPGDRTYMDNVVEIWWDPIANDPQSDRPGAYRYPRGGKRFREGEAPTDPTRHFEDGITAEELS